MAAAAATAAARRAVGRGMQAVRGPFGRLARTARLRWKGYSRADKAWLLVCAVAGILLVNNLRHVVRPKLSVDVQLVMPERSSGDTTGPRLGAWRQGQPAETEPREPSAWLEGFENLPAERWHDGRHLIVTYFEGDYSAERIEEVRAVLVNNLRNPHLLRVHVLCQDLPPKELLMDLPQHSRDKFVPVKVVEQPSYASMFAYANHVLARGAVAVIANSDIMLGDTIECARPMVPNKNVVVFNQTSRRLVLALSRHPASCGVELGELNECLRYRGSHDAFVFAPPLAESMFDRIDFVQNRLGAENRLLFELRVEGYRLANPCRKVRIEHLHCASRSRHVPGTRLARRGDGRYASVDPISKFECGDVIY